MIKTYFLDAETSGFTPRFGYDLVEVAVVDENGDRVYQSLAKPKKKIPKAATEVHGIGDEDVALAPSSKEVREAVYKLCKGARIGIYNAAFDLRFLPRLPVIAKEVFCMMKVVEERHSKKLSLSDAINHYGLKWPHGVDAHRAEADAYMLSQLYRAMNQQAPVERGMTMVVNGVTLEAFRGREFTSWREVPQGLKTRTQLKREGKQPGGVVFATVNITRAPRYRCGNFMLFKESEAKLLPV